MNKVPFDPGYSKHVSSFMYFNEQAKKMLFALKTPQQKSFKYRQLLSKIFEVMKKEIGFYYGCLLWAAYIKYNFEKEPKEIEGNSFLGRTEAELDNFDYLSEVNYLLEFFNQYPKDLSYYKVQGSKIEDRYIKAVEIYKNFLEINKSFINSKMSSDILLPKEIKELPQKDLPAIKLLIDLTVNDGNFERLFEYKLFNI